MENPRFLGKVVTELPNNRFSTRFYYSNNTPELLPNATHHEGWTGSEQVVEMIFDFPVAAILHVYDRSEE